MTAEGTHSGAINIVVIVDDEGRASALQSALAMVFPRALVTTVHSQALGAGKLPEGDVALVDGGADVRTPTETLRALRARGFEGPIVVVAPAPDDAALRSAIQSLGATSISRDDANPIALGTALTAALHNEPTLSAELLQARRVFAAGQATLSLQHGINNPLAALLAEAQLLQLEELTSEQRASADRMVELCRRIVALVRRLDALADR